MLKIREIDSKKDWERFLQKQEIAMYPFFQSWNWGEVQIQLGFDVVRVGIVDQIKNELLGVCQIIDIKAKRGHYLHVRHGPVLSKFSEGNFDVVLAYLKKMAEEKKASFIRVSPFIRKEYIGDTFFKKRGFINAPIYNMDAEICWVLDVTKSEDLLLKEMRKTHRYLIRKSQSMSIKIIRSKNVNDIEKFYPLYTKLSQRKHFVPHKGVREEFAVFAKENNAVLLLAEYDKNIIAGAMVVFTPEMAIYRHGASLEGYRDVPASYYLQWGAIKEAKKRSIKLYNFWGIAPFENKNHPWQGLTLFKTGFGGERREFMHAQDLPLSPLYWKTYGIELLTRVLRGY